MAGFVDHLQILPMPYKDGVRQPDGSHRPGGLGMATLSDLLNGRGWTARVEDLGFDKPMREPRLAEAFARAIGDGVESAWSRKRFPIVSPGPVIRGVGGGRRARGGRVSSGPAGAGTTGAGLIRRPRLEATSSRSSPVARTRQARIRPAR
jgi:hypothetical protein